jgi:hypothetical protein
MDCTPKTDGRQEEYTSLVDSLENGLWIKLPLLVMQDVGPAVQTLGGLLKLTNKETFVEASTIASLARLPVATVRKHLVTLDRAGWIRNKGRCQTRTGRPRRTCTIALTPLARDNIAPWVPLPWWATCHIKRFGKLNWGTKAVLSVIMARLMSLKGAVEQQDGCGCDADDVMGSIANMGDEDHFRFSLDELVKQTGLGRKAVVDAKLKLARMGIINLRRYCDDNGGDVCNVLYPNEAFRAVETPSGPGRFFLHFEVLE